MGYRDAALTSDVTQWNTGLLAMAVATAPFPCTRETHVTVHTGTRVACHASERLEVDHATIVAAQRRN